MWLKLGNFVQQSLFQALIEEKEAQYSHPRTKREKRYYTPLGEMVLVRRAYLTRDGIQVKVDEELGLPKDKWLPIVLELACALGVSSEFPNSHELFQKWTTLDLTQKTLANQVEKVGNQRQNQSRIDYRSYLKAGLMIGSGVVESSNRRVVTQRLKQAGMHWSFFGAEGVMALRAAYLSNSRRWSNFWSSKSYNHTKLA
jgi:hypothetical protein